MSFPTGPIDGQKYTTEYGSQYKYFAADNKWVKDSFTGLQGDTGAQGFTGAQGSTGTQGSTGRDLGATGAFNVRLSRRPGFQVDLTMPFDIQLDGWRMVSTGGTTGIALIDLYADTYANYPFTGTALNSGATGPNLSGWKNEDNDLSDWDSTTVSYDEIMRIHVSSITGIRDTTLTLKYHKA